MDMFDTMNTDSMFFQDKFIMYPLNLKIFCVLWMGLCGCLHVFSGGFDRAASGQELRIESVVPLPLQPQKKQASLIWEDDFDGENKVYSEGQRTVSSRESFGKTTGSMEQFYGAGKQGIGGVKVFFGDSPVYRPVLRDRQFRDVYWRIYVKHQENWQGGGPDKLSRATVFASSKWNQVMIAHVWSAGDRLTLDPASGERNGQILTTQYNDFPNLRWLGNKPVAPTPLFSSQESGWWVCVEARATLNTPGQKDGVMQLWIDGILETERKNLDWCGDYQEKGINAVFLESYWNRGSPVDQYRWIDNFVIATEPIGPVTVPRNPTILRSSFAGITVSEPPHWKVEIAMFPNSQTHPNTPWFEPNVVWKSFPISGEKDRVIVNESTGQFCDPVNRFSRQVDFNTGDDTANTELRLPPDSFFRFRICWQDDRENWQPWSRWHQCVKSATSPTQGYTLNTDFADRL